jgi:tetratricopeptide (TPR) repeat protein
VTDADLNELWQRAAQARAGGRLDEAIALYQQLNAVAPNQPAVLGELGLTLQARGRLAEAIEHFACAAALDDTLLPAHVALGRALAAASRFQEAVDHLSPLPARHPQWGAAAMAMIEADVGAFLTRLGRYAEGEAAARRAVARDARQPAALVALGGALMQQLRREEAVAAFARALEIEPNNPDSLANIGGPLADLDRLDEAIHYGQRAAAARPNSAIAHRNLAVIYRRANRLPEALAAAQRACALQPAYGGAQFELAIVQLLGGDLAEGWRGYDRFLQGDDGSPRRQHPGPRWDGRPLTGTLLISAECGFGDFIQLVRYVPMVAERTGRVIVESPAELLELVRTVEGAAEVIAMGTAIPPYDAQVPVMGLPAALGTTLATIPGRVPYVSADPMRVLEWHRRLGARLPGERRIGIVWAGRAEYLNDRRRSTRLAEWAPVLAVPGVRWFGLQKGPAVAQIAEMGAPAISDLSTELHSFTDTAAAMAALDLIITVDTAAAHLAGALGGPVWTLLPFSPDFRWLLGREDSPWYPTMRLFRQPAAGKWAEVFERIGRALADARGA